MSLVSSIVSFGSNTLRYCKANAPGILTITAMFGVIATGFISAECRRKAEEKIREEEEIKGEQLTFEEKAKKTWYYYIPPVVVGAMTIAAIGGAHSINRKRQLELVAAYNLLKEGSDKFKRYAIDEIGKNKVRQIEHKIHEDDIEDDIKDKKITQELIDKYSVTTGGAIFHDDFSHEYWVGTYEQVYRAVDRLNDKLRDYKTKDEKGNYNGGQNKVYLPAFLCDCGCPTYHNDLERWAFSRDDYIDGDPISKGDICDPHVCEFNGHMCTVVYLNLNPVDLEFLEDKWSKF